MFRFIEPFLGQFLEQSNGTISEWAHLLIVPLLCSKNLPKAGAMNRNMSPGL